MKWLFQCCTQNPDGSMTIPVEKVDRWQRQMQTPYAELSEGEQESDRIEADKTLKIIQLEPSGIALAQISHTNPINVYPDGDRWCALLGENLQEGEAGFGSTPIEAIQALIKQL